MRRLLLLFYQHKHGQIIHIFYGRHDSVNLVGFMFSWWMVHFLGTRQMWLNGVAVELFLLVQVLGYLSNYAFTTHNMYAVSEVYPLKCP